MTLITLGNCELISFSPWVCILHTEHQLGAFKYPRNESKRLTMESITSETFWRHLSVPFSDLPGHGPLLQGLVSLLGPEHCAPPLDGGGLVQVRVCSCCPAPQVTLQTPQSPQPLHPPLTPAERNVFFFSELAKIFLRTNFSGYKLR